MKVERLAVRSVRVALSVSLNTGNTWLEREQKYNTRKRTHIARKCRIEKYSESRNLVISSKTFCMHVLHVTYELAQVNTDAYM